MGGKSSKSTEKTVLGTTTTSNPYVTSTTNDNGTVTNFQNGNALETIYNSVNNNIAGLLNEYLNPSLNSITNQSKLNAFQNTLNNQMRYNMENNIVNPLSQRNMLRSSQATNLYNTAANQVAGQIANYASELLADSRNETASIINNLLNAYMQGYNVVNNNQAQSLTTSQSNATKTTESKQNTSPIEWVKLVSDLIGSINPSNIFGSLKTLEGTQYKSNTDLAIKKLDKSQSL